MEWRTRVTELLGCNYPVVQGAYGGFGTSAIAAPVSEAGAFGIITASALRTPERLRADIARARSMTDKPFGVNLSLGTCPRFPEMRDVAIEEKVPVIFTAAYNAKVHGDLIKEAGLVWIHKVTTLKHALAAERQGADAVVMIGIEGAGQKGPSQLTTLMNLTLASKYLKIPFLAAGGIGDGRGFLGALALGAEGVYLGTAFMATQECPISNAYKQRLVEGDPYDPKYRDRAFASPNPESIEQLRRGELTVARERPETYDNDDIETYSISGGSLAVGMIDGVPTVKEFVEAVIADAERYLMEGPLGAIAAAKLAQVRA